MHVSLSLIYSSYLCLYLYSLLTLFTFLREFNLCVLCRTRFCTANKNYKQLCGRSRESVRMRLLNANITSKPDSARQCSSNCTIYLTFYISLCTHVYICILRLLLEMISSFVSVSYSLNVFVPLCYMHVCVLMPRARICCDIYF